ncbi:uncharacterized protein BXIN_0003 [Babesia sp. Xinjiang]|uniref:uncharacterized protein n=1 Tax=Babesia sp. Xinjiang TaxID=462227 RepID=UPI000A2346C7|nr:uncharacterized protein BXIN_0003 [Babesia sp. Xinjiang]ORM39788.1 hypothetical protein BXIN_0003 [Babesia sp. Xinjiang]
MNTQKCDGTSTENADLNNVLRAPKNLLRSKATQVDTDGCACAKEGTVQRARDTGHVLAQCNGESINPDLEILETHLGKIGSSPDTEKLESLYHCLKWLIDNGTAIVATHVERIMEVAAISCDRDRLLALKILFLNLLAYRGNLMPNLVARITSIIDVLRRSRNSEHLLEGINIYYAIQVHHPYIFDQLTPQHRAYMEYLKEMAHYIRMHVPHENETVQIRDIRLALDALEVRHYAAITGMLNVHNEHTWE